MFWELVITFHLVEPWSLSLLLLFCVLMLVSLQTSGQLHVQFLYTSVGSKPSYQACMARAFTLLEAHTQFIPIKNLPQFSESLHRFHPELPLYLGCEGGALTHLHMDQLPSFPVALFCNHLFGWITCLSH